MLVEIAIILLGIVCGIVMWSLNRCENEIDHLKEEIKELKEKNDITYFENR